MRVIEIRDMDDKHHLTHDEIICCGRVMYIGTEGTCLYLRQNGSLGVAVVTLEEE